VLNALVLTLDRAQLMRCAEELAGAKDRSEYEDRLDVLEALIRDTWALRLGRPEDTIVNRDLFSQLQKIADEMPSTRAAQWLARIEEMRGELEVNINRKIASDALLVSMAAA